MTDCERFEGDFVLELRIFSAAFSALSFLLIIVSLVTWFWFRNKLVYLRKRGTSNAVILALGWIAVVFSASLGRSSNNNVFFTSCTAHTYGFITTVPLLLLALFSTVIQFRYQAKVNQALSKLPDASKSHISENEGMNIPRHHLFLAGSKFTLALHFVGVIIIFGIGTGSALSFCGDISGSDNCEFVDVNNAVILAFYLALVFALVLLVIFIKVKLRSYPDPFLLLSSITRGLLITLVIGLPASVMSSLNLGEPTEQDDIRYSYGIFIHVALFGTFAYLLPYQIYKAFKFSAVATLYVEFTLSRVLKDKTGHDLFKKYLITEFSVENLLFIDAVNAFKAAPDPQVKQTTKEFIYRYYFKTLHLNLSSMMKAEVGESFTSGTADDNVFDDAYDEIFGLMEDDSFVRFKQTQVFKDYIGASYGSQLSLSIKFEG